MVIFFLAVSYEFGHSRLSSYDFNSLLLRSAACNIAIKLLSPRLDRLSYRYSKVIHIGDYSCEYQVPYSPLQLP